MVEDSHGINLVFRRAERALVSRTFFQVASGDDVDDLHTPGLPDSS